MAGAHVSTDRRAIGARITLLREALNKTQSEFARMLGKSQQLVSNYERGHRRPELDEAFVIVRKTGVTLDWIYFGDRAGLSVRISDLLDKAESAAKQRKAG